MTDTKPNRDEWDPTIRLAILEDEVGDLHDKDAKRDVAGRRLIRRAAAVVVIVAAITTAGMWIAQNAADTATRTARRTAIDQAVSDEHDARSKLRACQTTNEFRTTQTKALAHTLVRREPFDPTADPSFATLDPSTQTFVRQLVARLTAANAAGDQAAADAYAKAFPVVSCDPQAAAVRAAAAKHAATVAAS